MKKFLPTILILFLIIGLGYVVLARFLRSENPEINHLLPESYSGVVIVHGSNTITNRTEGRKVFVEIDSKGHGIINRKYLVNWHATHFFDGITPIPEWIETKNPSDTKVRAFSIRSLNLKLFPVDMSDSYFIGTGKEFKEFEKAHPED